MHACCAVHAVYLLYKYIRPSVATVRTVESSICLYSCTHSTVLFVTTTVLYINYDTTRARYSLVMRAYGNTGGAYAIPIE